MKRFPKMVSMAGLAAVAAVSLPVATAAAAAPVRDSWHDVGTEVIGDFCGDLNVQVDHDIAGRFSGMAIGADGLYHQTLHRRGTWVFTNLDNGKSFTYISSVQARDLKVTDNGDGTLTVVGQWAGSARYIDADGKLVLRDPGMIRFEQFIDDAGTPADPSDDTLIEEHIAFGSTGLNETEGRDFCDDIHLFIG